MRSSSQLLTVSGRLLRHPHLLHPLLFALLQTLLLIFLLNTFISTTALAQESTYSDPPGRVAHLNYASGAIKISSPEQPDWAQMPVNRPLTSGDSIKVNGRAEIQVASSTLRLNDQSLLNFQQLSDQSILLMLSQGSLIVRLRDLSRQEQFEIITPNLTFSLQDAGDYRIQITAAGTTITVRQGAGIAYGEHDSITIRETETVQFSGNNLSHTSIARVESFDEFELWANQRNLQEEQSVSARYLPRDVIGYQLLDNHGSWETLNEYGSVWYPNPREIHANWAPYRNGKWQWIAPWGWTWVDSAPWGFAPFHYGRWAMIGTRWAWVPGLQIRHSRPVYAPALVVFMTGTDKQIHHKAGKNPGIGWFPLAPGEAYHPAYRTSPHYLDRLNHHFNAENRINHQVSQQFMHQKHGLTVLPSTSFVRGELIKPRLNHPNPSLQPHLRVQSPVLPERYLQSGLHRHAHPSDLLNDSSLPKNSTLTRIHHFNQHEEQMAKQNLPLTVNTKDHFSKIPDRAAERLANTHPERLGLNHQSQTTLTTEQKIYPATGLNQQNTINPINLQQSQTQTYRKYPETHQRGTETQEIHSSGHTYPSRSGNQLTSGVSTETHRQPANSGFNSGLNSGFKSVSEQVAKPLPAQVNPPLTATSTRQLEQTMPIQLPARVEIRADNHNRAESLSGMPLQTARENRPDQHHAQSEKRSEAKNQSELKNEYHRNRQREK